MGACRAKVEEFLVHHTHVGIGSNLGDRQANILAALQRVRRNGEGREEWVRSLEKPFDVNRLLDLVRSLVPPA